jgi:hypothetical protein
VALTTLLLFSLCAINPTIVGAVSCFIAYAVPDLIAITIIDIVFMFIIGLNFFNLEMHGTPAAAGNDVKHRDVQRFPKHLPMDPTRRWSHSRIYMAASGTYLPVDAGRCSLSQNDTYFETHSRLHCIKVQRRHDLAILSSHHLVVSAFHVMISWTIFAKAFERNIETLCKDG